jgi:hypothetical protein
VLAWSQSTVRSTANRRRHRPRSAGMAGKDFAGGRHSQVIRLPLSATVGFPREHDVSDTPIEARGERFTVSDGGE